MNHPPIPIYHEINISRISRWFEYTGEIINNEGEVERSKDTTKRIEDKIQLYQPCIGIAPYSSEKKLFQEVKDEITKCAYIKDPRYVTLAASIVFLSYRLNEYSFAPTLIAAGSSGSGKTRVFYSISDLCYRSSIFDNGTTYGGLKRMGDAYPNYTLQYDDAHKLSKDSRIQIVNYIANRGKPTVIAQSGEKKKIEAYSDFGVSFLTSEHRIVETRVLTRSIDFPLSPCDKPMDEVVTRSAIRGEIKKKLYYYHIKNRNNIWKPISVDLQDQFKSVKNPRFKEMIYPLIEVTPEPFREELVGLFFEIAEKKKELPKEEGENITMKDLVAFLYANHDAKGRLHVARIVEYFIKSKELKEDNYLKNKYRSEIEDKLSLLKIQIKPKMKIGRLGQDGVIIDSALTEHFSKFSYSSDELQPTICDVCKEVIVTTGSCFYDNTMYCKTCHKNHYGPLVD